VLTSVTSAINQHAHYTCTRNRNDKRLTYTPNWLYCTLEWYVELTIRHTTPDVRCTQLYSLTMTAKSIFCQLPTMFCFHCQPCISLSSSLKLRQTKYTTGDSCNGGIRVLNHWLSWSTFVNTHLYHSRQWFNIYLTLNIHRVSKNVPPLQLAIIFTYTVRLRQFLAPMLPRK